MALLAEDKIYMTKGFINMSRHKFIIAIGLISAALLAGIAGFGASILPRASQRDTKSDFHESIWPISLTPKSRLGRPRQPQAIASSNVQYLSINVGGIKRSYYLSSANKRGFSVSPLLIVLHGGGGSARSAMSVTNLAEAGAQNGIDVIFPEGTDVGHPFRWNTGLVTGSQIDQVNDVGFLDRLVQQYAPNNRPVFVAGLSNGGMMALRQLCQGKSRFSGAFIVAAGTSENILQSCTTSYKAPIAIINGRIDSVVPFNGGLVQRGGKGSAQSLSYSSLVPNTELVEFWRTRNLCLNSPTTALPIKHDAISPEAMTIKNYLLPVRRCKQTLSVVLNEGNHGWPRNTDTLTPREKARLQIRQRLAGRIMGTDRLDPGNLDTTRLVTTLIQRWSSK